jgi:hypothetical protein
MFSSEQKFEINGDKKENLKIAIDCALKLNDSTIDGFKFDNNRLIFGWLPKDKNEYKGYKRYPFEVTLDMATQIAWDYIHKTEEAREIFRNIEHLDIDGSEYKGWRIFVPQYYGKDRVEEANYSIIGIEPDLIYYAK